MAKVWGNVMRIVGVSLAIGLLSGSAEAADFYFEEGTATTSYNTSIALTPGKWNVEVWSSEKSNLYATAGYRYHYDVFVGPPPKPHNEFLEGNTFNYFEDSSTQNGQKVLVQIYVPETQYTFYNASGKYQGQGVPEGTSVYLEVKYENPYASFYMRPQVTGTASYTFRVSAAPEPGTWALMLLGFGAAGAMLRQRRLVDS